MLLILSRDGIISIWHIIASARLHARLFDRVLKVGASGGVMWWWSVGGASCVCVVHYVLVAMCIMWWWTVAMCIMWCWTAAACISAGRVLGLHPNRRETLKST